MVFLRNIEEGEVGSTSQFFCTATHLIQFSFSLVAFCKPLSLLWLTLSQIHALFSSEQLCYS